MPLFYYRDYTMLIVLPALLLAVYAQAKVQGTFAKYLRVRSVRGYTGAEAARRLLDANGLNEVSVEMINGQLTDHYDPRKRALRLSRDVYNSSSLAAIGVAAHETGHALQHDTGYVPLSVRNNIVPLANIGSQAAFPLFFLGLLFRSESLLYFGIFAFSAAVLFQIVTLPVEYNASNRAIAALEAGGFIEGHEVGPTRQVLSAAALTYVAATLMAVLQLLRLLVLAGAFRNNRR